CPGYPLGWRQRCIDTATPRRILVVAGACPAMRSAHSPSVMTASPNAPCTVIPPVSGPSRDRDRRALRTGPAHLTTPPGPPPRPPRRRPPGAPRPPPPPPRRGRPPAPGRPPPRLHAGTYQPHPGWRHFLEPGWRVLTDQVEALRVVEDLVDA